MPINSSKSKMSGFTLIELMIVVSIILVMSSIALSIFLKYDCLAKQSEAKSSLSKIYKAQIAYFSEYNKFSSSLSVIGFSISNNRYTYNAGGNDDTFVATATNGPNNDAWSIDQNKILTNTTPGCSK